MRPDDGRRVFRVDGDVYVLPSLPEGLVTEAASRGDWLSLIPGSLEEPGRQRMRQRLGDPSDGFDLLWCVYVAEAVLESVCGVPWRVMCRLAAGARAQWLMFDGWALQQGFDPRVLSPARFAAAVMAWARASMSEEKDWRRFEIQLWRQQPRPTLEARLEKLHGEAVDDSAPPSWDEGALFDRAMASLG